MFKLGESGASVSDSNATIRRERIFGIGYQIPTFRVCEKRLRKDGAKLSVRMGLKGSAAADYRSYRSYMTYRTHMLIEVITYSRSRPQLAADSSHSLRLPQV